MLICLSQYGRILANQVIKVKIMVVMVMLKYELKKTKVPDVFFLCFLFFVSANRRFLHPRILQKK